jgi:membrane-bound lytic murein transglycosylase A
VDRALHVYGTPFFIQAELPIDTEKSDTKFRKLMIAQDTGSAIVGPARADIYFGAGADAGHIAGRVKNPARFVMLMPRALDPVEAGKAMPLPLARPGSAPLPQPLEKPAEAAVPAPSPADKPANERAAAAGQAAGWTCPAAVRTPSGCACHKAGGEADRGKSRRAASARQAVGRAGAAATPEAVTR